MLELDPATLMKKIFFTIAADPVHKQPTRNGTTKNVSSKAAANVGEASPVATNA